MAKTYPVACECTKVHEVPGTDAGRAIDCTCGRTIEIPTLNQLRASAGESTSVIEIELFLKLQEGLLPDETRCLSCDVPTEETAYTLAVCEESTSSEPTLLKMIFAFILFIASAPLHLGLFSLNDREEDIHHGRTVKYNLPLRLCTPCRKRTWRRQIKRYVLMVPIYQRLLAKYPHTKLSRLATGQ